MLMKLTIKQKGEQPFVLCSRNMRQTVVRHPAAHEVAAGGKHFPESHFGVRFKICCYYLSSIRWIPSHLFSPCQSWSKLRFGQLAYRKTFLVAMMK